MHQRSYGEQFSVEIECGRRTDLKSGLIETALQRLRDARNDEGIAVHIDIVGQHRS